MTKLTVTIDDQQFAVEMLLSPQCGQECRVTVDGREISLIIPQLDEPGLAPHWMIIDGRPYEVTFDKDLNWLIAHSGLHRVAIEDSQTGAGRLLKSDGRLKAPIPGLISHVFIQQGAAVSAGQTILILEAMKMENEIRAPFNAVLTKLAVHKGQTVAQDDLLAILFAT
jgi:geranyl-CoA carboxylase alpha subunit